MTPSPISDPELPSEQPLELPDVHQGTMDKGLLRRYLAELADAAVELSVSVKDAPRAKFRVIASLDALGPLLLEPSVWGAQLSYRLGAERWVDTFIVRNDEYHLVRMSPLLRR